MDLLSDVDGAKVVPKQPSSRWSERAVETRALIDAAEDLHERMLLEHIAPLYDALAFGHSHRALF
jgi:hypothetical protein